MATLMSGEMVSLIVQAPRRVFHRKDVGLSMGHMESLTVGYPQIVTMRKRNPMLSPSDPGPPGGGRFVTPATIAFG